MNGNSTLNGRWSENELATIKNVIQGEIYVKGKFN